jgi:hypothetical protein
MADDQLLVNTGKSQITLDELGSIQPGMARFMAEIGPRISNCYHAGKAQNWPLAAYMLKECVKVMQAATVTRPKYVDDMGEFIVNECDAVLTAISKQDLAAFEEAFAAMVETANAYHEKYEKPYLRYVIPESPPADLDFTPRP